MKRFLIKCRLLLLPSLLGIACFYIIPYLRVLYYSVIENQFSRKFTGLGNYKLVLSNEYFKLALFNSVLLIVIAVPILLVISFFISILMMKMEGKWKLLRGAFIFPMLVPTASLVIIWRTIFNGIESAVPVYFLFMYKNIGLQVILFSAAFSNLDPYIYEAAKLDGAAKIMLHGKITIPLIFPTVMFNFLIGIVYSFKVFRESYLYFGNVYPPDDSYTLQYYMNNHFLKLDYQYLATGAVITSLIIYVIVFCGIKIQKKYDF